MAQSVNLWGATYSDVPALDVPKTGGGTARFTDTTPTTAIESDVASGKIFIKADGSQGVGTGTGGGGATQHEIYLEFSDSTDTTINVYYEDALLGTMITAYQPSTWTYSSKTVMLAQLDNVTWYDKSEAWETLYNNTYYTENGAFWLPELSSVYPTVGSVWRITLDSIEYRCTAVGIQNQYGGAEIFVGNPVWAGSAYDDDGSDVPVAFSNRGFGAWNGFSDLPDGNHTLKIERQV